MTFLPPVDSKELGAPAPAAAVCPRSRSAVARAQGASRHSKGFAACIFLAALGGVLAVLYGTSPWGSYISSDSATYISTAQNLARGAGYQDFQRLPFVMWPPLFPTVLASLHLLGLDVLQAGRYLNAVVFGLLILSTCRLLRRYVQSQVLLLAGTLSTLVSLCLLMVCSAIWSEPLFILFCIWSLIWLTDYWDEPTLPMLLLAAIATALACLTRYAGMPIIVAGASLVFWRHRASLLSAVTAACLYAMVSAAPLAVWLVHNYLYTHTLMGPRTVSANTLVGSLLRLTRTMTAWLLPRPLPLGPRVALIVVLALAMLLICRQVPRPPGGHSLARRSLLIPLTFMLGYLGFLIVSAVRVTIDLIDDRLLSPAFPMCLCVLFCLVDRFCTYVQTSPRHAWIGRVLVPAVAMLSLVYPGAQFASNIRLWRRQGAPNSYSSAVWQHSPLICFLRGHPLNGALCSNAPDGVWTLTGLDVVISPGRNDSRSIEWLVRRASDVRPTYLVWCNRKHRRQRLTVKELSAYVDLQPAYTFSDGTIYRVQLLQASAIQGATSLPVDRTSQRQYDGPGSGADNVADDRNE